MVIPAKGMKGKDFKIRKAEKVYLLVHNKKSEDKASAYADEIVRKLKAAKIRRKRFHAIGIVLMILQRRPGI